MNDAHKDFVTLCIVLVAMVVAGIATIVLAILKAVGTVHLSWVMVFAPIWMLPILAFTIILVGILFILLTAFIRSIKDK